MIRLHIKRGLLGEDGTESVELDPRARLTARHLREHFARHLPSSVKTVVMVDGRELPVERFDDVLEDGSDVLMAPQPTTGVEIGAAIVYALIASAASFAISYVVNALSPRQKPPGIPAERGDQTSATYAWDGIQTNYGQGFPVPWVYGEHIVGGTVISTDLYATTVGGSIDDRLTMILALCEGPIYRIGDTIAGELDGLGGLVGQAPGSPLPSDIRVNENVLQSTATGTPVTNLLTGSWSGAQPVSTGEILLVYSGAVLLGHLQIVEIRNAQASDLDVLVIDGTIAVGNRIERASIAPTAFATVTVRTTVTRVNLAPGAIAWIRPGTLDQSPLPANPFRGSSVTESPGSQLAEANDEATFTYTGNEELATVGFVLSFPSGLYSQDALGNLAAYPVQFELYWRPEGTTAWRGFYSAVNGLPLRTRTVGVAPRVGPVLDSFGANLAPTGGPSVRAPIEVRLVRKSPSGGTTSVSAAVWRNVFFNSAHILAYPRVALLGLQLSAGARFSGGLPQVRTKIAGKMVRVWDATNGFSERCWDVPAAPFDFMDYPPGQNPAWIFLDYVTSPEGLGRWFTDDDVDLPAIRRWAANCDSDPSPAEPWNEPQYACDYVGDSPRPMWEHALAICAAGRAAPTYRNGKISVVYEYRDAHGDAGITVAAKQPLQLLTSGNCEKVQVTWLPKGNRPTAFVFQFLDRDELYTQNVFPVEDPDSELNTPSSLRPDQWRPETVQAYGVTRKSQLYREGIYRHRAQRLIRRELTLVTGRWALAAEVGELFDFEHELMRPFDDEVPINGVIAVGGTDVSTVTVDHLALSATEIVIRDPDGKPQRRTISGTVEDHGKTVCTLTVPVTCTAGAPCVIGIADKLVNTYQIVAITLQQDIKREIRALQWVPEIHEPVTPSEFQIGAAEDGLAVDNLLPTAPPQDDGSTAVEVRVIATRSGTHRILWSRPPNRRNGSARVYVRDQDLDTWILAGETGTDELEYAHFAPLRIYEVAVCLEGWSGQHALPEAVGAVTFTAEEFPPYSLPTVTNARAAALDLVLLLQWDDLDVRDLEYFEVRHGTDWNAGKILHRARAARALLANPPGGGSVLIAARSSSGLYGSPVVLELPAWSPPFTAAAAARDEFSGTPAGTHSGTEWNATDGVLQLQDGEYSGTYTAAELDAGYQAPIYWQVVADFAELELTPVQLLNHQVGSGEALWRTVNGRPASPALPGSDWQSLVSDMTLTLDDAARHSERLVRGHAGEVGSNTRTLVESRFEVGGAWGAWKEHADRTVVARKMQVRVRMDRISSNYSPLVVALSIAGHV